MAKKILAISLVALVLTLGACGGGSSGNSSAGRSSTSSTASSDTIRIAVAAPMTGDNANYGLGFYNAALMMAEEWNAKGGCLGKTVEIVQYDDRNSPEEAVAIATRIASDGNIAGVIGHFASGVCMVAAPIYQENGIIEISPSSSHPDYSSIGNYIFRNNTVVRDEAAAAIGIAVDELGKTKIGVISIMTDWGTSTSDIVKELIAQMGDRATLVAHEEVVESSDDYRPAITKLHQAGADVCICVGMYSLDGPVARQYKEINPDIQLIGFSNAYDVALLELGGDAVEGMCFPVLFYSGSPDPAVRRYVDGYTAKYGSEPSALTSAAYDSVGMLLEAIEAAGTTDSAAVRDELYKIEYPGVTGRTRFDSNGDVKKEFVKMTVRNGQFDLF